MRKHESAAFKAKIVREMLCEKKTIAQRIGRGWVISGHVSDTFDGFSTQFRVPGCVSAQFLLHHLTAESTDALQPAHDEFKDGEESP